MVNFKSSENGETAVSGIYQLAASTRGGSIRIYGESLEEVCRRHRSIIRRTKDSAAKALEKGRYALFMLEQIDRFHDRRARLLLIAALLETAIDTLTQANGGDSVKYGPMVRRFKEQLSRATGMDSGK